jgi:hypothetical protein
VLGGSLACVSWQAYSVIRLQARVKLTLGICAARAAAGCGDKVMALKLVELGTDINCKDSVGGEASKSACCLTQTHIFEATGVLICC